MKAVLMLEEITTTRAARITAAHDRHKINTPLVIYADEMTHSATIRIITAAAKDAKTALAARYRASGQHLMYDLGQQIPHDLRRMTTTTTRTSEAANERKTAEAIRKDAAQYDRIAQRIRISDEERAAAAAMRDTLRDAATAHSGHAADINRSISTAGHSDAADIIQNAIVARLEDIRSGKPQNHRHSISAAGAGINELAAAKGYTATRTKVQPITQEQAQALADQWHMFTTPGEYITVKKVPFAVLGNSLGYFDVEYRNTNRFPAGYYLVKHYATTAPIRLDSYAKGAKDEESVTLSETLKELHTIDQSDAERDHEPQLAALLNAANLTERERNILAWATDNHNRASVAVGVKAVQRHMQRTDEKADAASNSRAAAVIRNNAAKRAEIIRQLARLDAAMTLFGVSKNENTRRSVKKRIKDKLERAQVFAPLWYMLDNQPIKPAAVEQYDFLTWAERSSADPAPVIDWKRKPCACTVQTISTPAQREQEAIERRKAEQEAHTRAEEAKAAHKAQIEEAEASAGDWFIKPASASAAIFEAVERERRAAAFEASYARYEAVEQRRKAEAAAQEEAQQAAQTERHNRYNAALKAALAAFNTTWNKATQEQREQATAAARAAAKKE